MQLSAEQVKACCPTYPNPAALAAPLNLYLPAYGIDSVNEVAAFLAQCGHESVDFTRLEENLNYSAEALHRIWPRRFPDDATCQAYARNPQKIANRVYASRMGNGDEASGDGWRHRGAGPLQVTGKDNQSAFAASKGVTLNEAVAHLRTLGGGIEGACWFWSTRKLNALVEAGDFDGVSDMINIGRKTAAEGDSIGYADRKGRYVKCLKALSAAPPA